MRTTDYAKIASRYDEHEARHRIGADPWIKTLLAARPPETSTPLFVLDLACGTGNYLKVQIAAHPHASVAWRGLDFSTDMLAIAQGKVPSAELQQGDVHALPFADRSVDYIACRFAFHHFVDKARALDEMCRVLTDDGVVRLENVVPEMMPGWWGYRFFPQAVREDEKRFWSLHLLAYELELRGRRTEAEVTVQRKRLPLSEIALHARRRDISQLAILDEDEYRRGLHRLEAEFLAEPDATVPDEIAVGSVVAIGAGREMR